MYGLDALLGMFDVPSISGALGLMSVGIWMIRLQRITAMVRLGGLLLVLLAGVLVVGGASGVVRVDAAALRTLLDGAVGALGNVLALTGA